MAAVRHLGFVRIEYFNARFVSLSKINFIFHQNTSRSYCNLSFFSIWRSSVFLDLYGIFWVNPRRVLGGLDHCTKFNWNCCSNFDNTKVWIFSFCLKMTICASFGFCLVKMGENGYFLHFYLSRNAIIRIDIVQIKLHKNRYCGLVSDVSKIWGHKKNKPNRTKV